SLPANSGKGKTERFRVRCRTSFSCPPRWIAFARDPGPLEPRRRQQGPGGSRQSAHAARSDRAADVVQIVVAVAVSGGRIIDTSADEDIGSYNYFLTISAFSSIATPPRSASLPFRVMVLPQYSASWSFIG